MKLQIDTENKTVGVFTDIKLETLRRTLRELVVKRPTERPAPGQPRPERVSDRDYLITTVVDKVVSVPEYKFKVHDHFVKDKVTDTKVDIKDITATLYNISVVD